MRRQKKIMRKENQKIRLKKKFIKNIEKKYAS
jgi:hypothetical protein